MWMQDRLDEGRRVVERGLGDGRKIVDRGLGDGLRIVDRGWSDGRRLFDRSVGEGRKVADRTYGDGRKIVDRGYDQGRKVAGRTYDDGRRMVAARLEEGRRALAGEKAGPGVGSVLWPTVLLAAGAGAAFWWWTQWSRGKAESEATAHVKPTDGDEGRPAAEPEMVMAHNVAPKAQGSVPKDVSDAKLVEPAEELMQHAPVDPTPPRGAKAGSAQAVASKAGGKTEAMASAASAAMAGAESLTASLGVQGAATGPKRAKALDAGSNGTVAPGVKAKAPRGPRKGPTVM